MISVVLVLGSAGPQGTLIRPLKGGQTLVEQTLNPLPPESRARIPQV